MASGGSPLAESGESANGKSSGSTMDLLEQRQAREQARLLNRFKELRNWQLQQQEIMMVQQRQQLAALQQEQHRVQTIISQQRQSQWGQSGPSSPRKSNSTPLMSPLVSKRRSHTNNTSPAVPDSSNTDELSTSHGLPTPDIPDVIEPNYPDHYTNPELFSNPETNSNLEEIAEQIDERLTIPDTESESSDAISTLKQLKTRLFDDADYQDIAGSEESPGERPLGERYQFGESDSDQDEEYERRYFEEEEEEEGSDEEESEEGEDHEIENGGNTTLDPDERPVQSAMSGATKTFEELIEEELRKEQLRSQSAPDDGSHDAESPRGSKRTFLKRGEGISRFNKAPLRTGPRKKIVGTDSGLSRRKNNDVVKKENVKNNHKTKTKKPPYKDVISKLKLKTHKIKEAKSDGKTTKQQNGERSPLSNNKHVSQSSDKSVLTNHMSKQLSDKIINNQTSKHSDKIISSQASKQSGENNPSKMSLEKTITNHVSRVSTDKTLSTNHNSVPYSDRKDSNSLPTVPGVSKNVPNGAKRSISPNVRGSGNFHSQPIPDVSSSNGITNKLIHQHEKDEEDLEEFEILEEFADNMSFTSNSSLVVRVLQEDKLRKKQVSSSSQNTLRPYLIAKQSQVISNKDTDSNHSSHKSDKTLTGSDSSDSDSSEISWDSENDLTPRASVELRDKNPSQNHAKSNQLTSSPRKNNSSNLTNKTVHTNHSELTNNVDATSNTQPNILVNGNAENGSETDETESDIFTKAKSPMRRKIAGRNVELSPIGKGNKLSRLLRSSVNQPPVSLDDFINPKPLSASEDFDEFRSSQLNKIPGKLKSIDQSSNLNSLRNRISINSSSSSSESDTDSDDTTPVMINHINDKNVVENDKNPAESHTYDDEQSWGDVTLNKTKKDQESSGDESETTITDVKKSADLSSPGPSGLVLKLFPKLRAEKNAQQVIQQEKLERPTQQTSVLDGIQSKALRDKLTEMESEIERFRRENAQLEVLRKEREEGISKLKKEITDFEKEKCEELERLQTFKTEEMKKLRHEKKVFETYKQSTRPGPDKKEREEIDTLKTQLAETQDELKRKETRWTASSGRMRARIEELEGENEELKEEIKILERSRLAWLQKEQAPSRTVSQQSSSTTYTNSIDDTDTDMDYLIEQENAAKSKPKKPVAQKPQAKKNQPAPTKQPQPSKVANHVGPNKSQKKPKLLSVSKSPRVTQAEDVPRSGPVSQPTQQLSDYSVSNQPAQPATRKTTNSSFETSVLDKANTECDETCHADGKVERVYTDGAREINFPNGTRKEISGDGLTINVMFFNGDSKQILPDQRVIYYYADAKTTHTTYPDGLEVLQFPNNQTEKHYPDGTKEITFEDQTVKYLFANGNEESIFADGTVIKIESSGDKTIEFPNGQREIHTLDFKRREYPDGTVKTVYPDGRQETHYAHGRVRIKDRDGNIIVDKIV